MWVPEIKAGAVTLMCCRYTTRTGALAGIRTRTPSLAVRSNRALRTGHPI